MKVSDEPADPSAAGRCQTARHYGLFAHHMPRFPQPASPTPITT
jgi:hypothetical protein